MKKILFLVQLPPPVHGASIMNQHVINIFEKSKYTIRTIELRFVESIDQIGKVSFLKIIRFLNVGYNIFKNILFWRPDIVYFTLSPFGGAFYRDVVYVFILKIFRVKIAYHLHGKGIKNNFNKWWKKVLYKFVFKNTTVIHLSPILEEDIKELDYSEIYFVPNGIENTKYIEREQSKNTTNLLFLSNLIFSKGLFVLLEACKLLKEKELNFNLNIVGKEGDITFDELESRIKLLELKGTIQILGPRYDDEKYMVLNSSDALVFPTYCDCFPLVLLEGMQFGLPIVSTYEGAIPEIVDDGVNGFLIKQKDAHALAEKLEILIRDKHLREKMGRAGREKFLKEYTIEKFEENVHRVFHEIIYAN